MKQYWKSRIGSFAMTVMMLCSMTACGNTESSGDGLAELVVSDGTARITIENGEFRVGDKPIWLCGANTPWDNWNDFGGNFDPEFWDQHFADLHENGINSSRVWLLCSGDYGIQFDENGMVTGMKQEFWDDVDQLMAIAAEHEIYIMATLMSFDCCKTGNRNHKKFRAMIQSPELTQSFVDNYVIPFAKRYDSNDYLYSIDICNEPDWINENEESGKIDWKPLVTFFGKVSAGIHQNSDILVTTGLAMVRNNSDKHKANVLSDELLLHYAGEDSQMDFYSVHFYDWMLPYYGNPLTMSPEDYGLPTDKPNVMGECSALGSVETDIDLCQAAKQMYENGWDGLYPWTSNGVDGNGGFELVSAYGKQMKEMIPDLIFPLG